MGGGGGGGQSGGSVVQTTAPWAARLAGQYGANAAYMASQQATEMYNTAINSLNRQYQQARYDVQPYRMAGVQALDQLNQYMGLDPYNPGISPTAPDKVLPVYQQPKYKALAGMAAGLLPAQDAKNPKGTPLGVSSDSAHNIGSLATLLSGSGQDLSTGEQYFLSKYYDAGGAPGMTGSEFIEQFNKQAEAQYKTDKADYDQNKLEYDQNLDWYNKYKGEGPFTSEQVAEKIGGLPGYQAQLSQGVDAIQKSASSKGYLGSGRALKELMGYGQNTLSQFYGDELSRLAGLVNQGYGAATASAGISQQRGNSLAGLYASLGDTKANAQLAAGNSLSQALIAANQQFKVIGQQDSGGGGGMGGIGSILGGVSSIMGMF